MLDFQKRNDLSFSFCHTLSRMVLIQPSQIYSDISIFSSNNHLFFHQNGSFHNINSLNIDSHGSFLIYSIEPYLKSFSLKSSSSSTSSSEILRYTSLKSIVNNIPPRKSCIQINDNILHSRLFYFFEKNGETIVIVLIVIVVVWLLSKCPQPIQSGNSYSGIDSYSGGGSSFSGGGCNCEWSDA